MKPLDKLNEGLLKLLLVVGGLFLLAMVALTCYNISMRPFKLGISGVYEVMGYFGAMVISCGLAYTQSKKAHLSGEPLCQFLPQTDPGGNPYHQSCHVPVLGGDRGLADRG